MLVDFVKLNYTDPGYRLPTGKSDFIISVNHETGETDGKKTGKYFDMEIIRYLSGRTLIKGSLHKFYNRTEFNGNDFNIDHLHSVLTALHKEIAVSPEYCRLENIEIGVNVQLPFDPNKVLQNLLFHRSAEFNKTISGSFYYQSAKRDYIIKIYNKTAQYEKKLKKYAETRNIMNTDEKKAFTFFKNMINDHLQPNTLRFEIKFLKMNVLNEWGLIYLSDLLKPGMGRMFKDLLVREFEEVYFYDYTTNESSMRKAELYKLRDYRNPNYWISLGKKDKYYHKKRFEQLTLKYSQNIKGKILELIKEKTEGLITKSLDFSTDNFKEKQNQKFRLFDRSDIGSESPIFMPHEMSLNKDRNLIKK